MRKKILFTALLVFGLAAGTVQAQKVIGSALPNQLENQIQTPNPVPSHRTCGSMDLLEQQMDTDQGLKARVEQDQKNWEQFYNGPAAQRTVGGSTIPVVVHIIYTTNPNFVTDANVNSQITVLNEDYGRTNSDASNTPSGFQSVAANTGIQFCLATQDENGSAHSGINRVQSSLTTHNMNNAAALKALVQWDPTLYLNMWVVQSINSGQVLGYATFPTSLASSPNLDGVVIAGAFFGYGSSGSPYNLGRTTTHEVGHWLGLYHTFQGGCSGMTQGTCAAQGDGICDTPPTANPNYNCPGTINTCSESFPSNQNDMTMNYMDYVNDNCMNLFTTDQSTRMNYFLNTSRSALLNSPGCNGGGTGGTTTACGSDTVNYPLPGTATIYGASNGGYVSGQNGYGDAAKAERYSNIQGYSEINGMRLVFGQATAFNGSSTVDCHVWSETAGEPGSILHTETLNINDIITAAGDVTVMFANPVNVSGAFYIGCDIDYGTPGDTVAFVNNTTGDQASASAWEQWNTGDWYAYDDASAWGLTVGHFAHPVVTGLVSTISPAAPSIPSGGSVGLTASANGSGITYTWAPSTGLSCTSCANPTANPTTTTTYTVTALDPTANCTTTVNVTVTVGPVAIENDLFEEAVLAYPNPSNGNFILEFNSTEINDLNISIYNNLGQKLYHEKLSGFMGQYRNGIALESIPAGVYHLRITNGERSYYQKMIFE